MAAYLTRALLNGRGLSNALLLAAFGTEEAVDAAIVVASNKVQAIVRGNARNGSPELGETTTNEAVMSATYWAFRVDMAHRPETSFPLPESADIDPDREIFLDLKAGRTQIAPEAAPSIANAVQSSTATTVPRRTSDTDLAGF